MTNVSSGFRILVPRRQSEQAARFLDELLTSGPVALRLELISTAAAWVVGVVVGAVCALMAFVLVPEVGLFGDANTAHERVIGPMAALACGPAFVAGPLVAGARPRDASVLVPAILVAAAFSVVVLVAAW